MQFGESSHSPRRSDTMSEEVGRETIEGRISASPRESTTVTGRDEAILVRWNYSFERGGFFVEVLVEELPGTETMKK